MLLPNFLGLEACARLIELSEKQDVRPAKIRLIDEEEREISEPLLSAKRVTTIVETANMGDQIVPIVAGAYRDCVSPNYGVTIEWFEFPQLLKYDPGGHYGEHNDSENFDTELGGWRRMLDRDYSILLYLNDQFEGGDLLLSKLDYKIRPHAGLLVAFPSDHHYAHIAEPVKSGTRYVIVSWAAAVGTQRVCPEPPSTAVFTDKKYVPADRVGQ